MAEIPPEAKKLLQHYLAGIARIFRSPRITLVVRAADIGSEEGANATGDLVLSNDNPSLAIAALRARMVASVKLLAGTAEEMNVEIKPGSDVIPRFEGHALETERRPSGNNFRRG